MVRALNPATCKPATLHRRQTCASVPAGVIKRAQDTSVVERADQVFAGDVGQEIIARCLERIPPADANPEVPKDSFLLFAKDRLGREIALRERETSSRRRSVGFPFRSHTTR
jgi:hypothetical protein